jgi:hypothetical protein
MSENFLYFKKGKKHAYFDDHALAVLTASPLVINIFVTGTKHSSSYIYMYTVDISDRPSL